MLSENLKKNYIDDLIKKQSEQKEWVRQHDRYVKSISRIFAESMAFSHSDITDFELAGEFHDIGKIYISDSLLNKSERLTEEEFDLIKNHVLYGYLIFKNNKELVHLSDIILYHHERFDGKGYVCGLKSEEIPLMARMLSIVDSYEAMTGNRPYSKPLSVDRAVNELIIQKEKQFDPDMVDIFIDKVIPSWGSKKGNYPDPF